MSWVRVVIKTLAHLVGSQLHYAKPFVNRTHFHLKQPNVNIIRKRATSGRGVRAYVNIFQNGQCSVTPNYICDMLMSMDCPEELHRKIKVTHKYMYHMVQRTLR
jgi:hypothetical protein